MNCISYFSYFSYWFSWLLNWPELRRYEGGCFGDLTKLHILNLWNDDNIDNNDIDIDNDNNNMIMIMLVIMIKLPIMMIMIMMRMIMTTTMMITIIITIRMIIIGNPIFLDDILILLWSAATTQTLPCVGKCSLNLSTNITHWCNHMSCLIDIRRYCIQKKIHY